MPSVTECPPFTCPVHKRPLSSDGNGYACPESHSFKTIKDIPRFVSGETYADLFGAQWNRHRLTQLDSYTGTTITRDRTRNCMGEQIWDALPGKHVLECGCGAGRFTEVLLHQGALVTSVDLSAAVEANAANFPQNEMHRVTQADIRALPFPEQSFDVVFCLGVIQHTPSPEETIAALYAMVKPGGWLVIDHYTYNISHFTKSAALLRHLMKRLSPETSRKWVTRLIDLFLPLHRMVRSFYPLQALLSRISPVICYYHRYPWLSDELQREWALLDTHDTLTDWYKHFRTKGQLRRHLEVLGATGIYSEYGGLGVEARAQRPR